MTEDRRAKMLEKVRSILALADDEQLRNPEAADNYRAKADELMTAYAIEQWMLDKTKPEQTTKPEVRDFNFEWWRRNERSDELWELFTDVAYHCRCVVAVRGYGTRSWKTIPVIGLPSDIDYMDLLFTHLMLQMGKQLEAKPDPELSFGENAYQMRATGMARPRIAKLLYMAGLIPGTDGEGYVFETGDRIPYEQLAPGKEKSLRAKVRVAGEKWGQANGFDPTTTVNPRVFQRSFARGFVREIDARLSDMRRSQEQRPTSGGNSMALALRDIRKVALDLYEELFPPPKLDPDAKVSRAIVRDLKVDTGSYIKGKRAGAKAQINVHPSKGIRNNPRPLPKGE